MLNKLFSVSARTAVAIFRVNMSVSKLSFMKSLTEKISIMISVSAYMILAEIDVSECDIRGHRVSV
jgi:hypothetical protein